ncbi:MAG: hypothetical protein INQ03_08770 [Candidatus Heimdallarchaeota archaeon]|nr:hypothetical protein [Candidatus Heimdallarchaeota archaeon]
MVSIKLTDWMVIKVSGSDIKQYLDGIVPNNLDTVTVDRSIILTPKAKIQSVFWLEKIDSGFLCYIPPVFIKSTVELLLKYKLSLDVRLEDITNESDPLYLISADTYLSGIGKAKFVFQEDIDSTGESFEDFLIANQQVPPELLINQNPVEAGLYDTIYLPKGCFLGQEPISRMINIGKPRSLLYFVFGEVEPSITDDPDVKGEIFKLYDGAAILQIKSSISDFTEFKQRNKIDQIVKIGQYPEFKRV